MGQILVWECERTGELFRTKRPYTIHLAKLRRQDERDEAERLRVAERDAKNATIYQCRSFAEVESWLMENWTRLIKDHFYGRTNNTLTSIHFYDMSYNETSSNSHSAPRGKKTNWGGTRGKDVPRGYPGWYGRITATYKGDHGVSDILKILNICTGSGGGGTYDVTLWLEDFPNLHQSTLLRYPALASIKPEERYRITTALHDLNYLECTTTKTRANKWHDFERKINSLVQFDSEFKLVRDKIDRLARAFGGTTFRYYVSGQLKRDMADRYDNARQGGRDIPILPLGDRMWQMREFLMQEPDLAIEWKLRGDLPPDCEIIDLAKRAERLLREGKIKSIMLE